MIDGSAGLGAEAGLCALCVHALARPTNRGTTYLRCALATTDSRFPRYPRLPVLSCAGFARVGGDAPREGGPATR